jgi:CheY-like chemotaxis protein
MCRRTFERQVQIDVDIADEGAAIVCDPTAIEQMLVNLLINARDAVAEAGPASPCITVDVSACRELPKNAPHETAGPYIRIRVRDNGMGMSEAVKQRIFEPFFTTKAPGKGTGLGLATSYAIARDHGGFITLESEYGSGTTFSVFLPRAAGEDRVSRSAPPISSRAARPGRILLVEDEAGIRRVVRTVLGARGHDVHAVEDGETAVAALEAGFVPNVVLLDRSVPGWSMTTTLREIGKRAGSAPVLLFTGQAVTDDERRMVRDVLTKPLSTEELVLSVERWLPKRSAPG